MPATHKAPPCIRLVPTRLQARPLPPRVRATTSMRTSIRAMPRHSRPEVAVGQQLSGGQDECSFLGPEQEALTKTNAG